LDPVAPRRVVDALRARAASSCVVVTTPSPRDAMQLADVLGVLASGTYTPIAPDFAHSAVGAQRMACIRVVVSPSHGKSGAAALARALGASAAVVRLETTDYALPSGAVALVVSGPDLDRLSREVTHSIATERVDVELVEPSTSSLDALRAALSARAMMGPSTSTPLAVAAPAFAPPPEPLPPPPPGEPR
ncbi:MAG TPA: hypothetical protein VM580_06455, partial [Labilithrix sp.]|nr:hypothetical protein [Labilithrix sp.]